MYYIHFIILLTAETASAILLPEDMLPKKYNYYSLHMCKISWSVPIWPIQFSIWHC